MRSASTSIRGTAVPSTEGCSGNSERLVALARPRRRRLLSPSRGPDRGRAERRALDPRGAPATARAPRRARDGGLQCAAAGAAHQEALAQARLAPAFSPSAPEAVLHAAGTLDARGASTTRAG